MAAVTICSDFVYSTSQHWIVMKLVKATYIEYFEPWLPWCAVGKESAYSAGDLSSIPGLGRSPGKGYGYPLQFSCLGNPRGRRAWCAAVYAVAKSWTKLTEQQHWILWYMPGIHLSN